MISVPSIAVVKVDEFEAVPAYIRGRVPRDAVNDCITVIHNVLAAKYKILAQPRASLSAPVLKKYNAFRDAETDDTKGTSTQSQPMLISTGMFFFTEDEIKMLSEYKLDPSARTCLSVLRALGRLKEHRSAGFVRYVVV